MKGLGLRGLLFRLGSTIQGSGLRVFRVWLESSQWMTFFFLLGGRGGGGVGFKLVGVSVVRVYDTCPD